MDPDACLAEIRRLIAVADDATEYTDEREDALGEAATMFENLDSWLASNGFLPKAWSGANKQPIG